MTIPFYAKAFRIASRSCGSEPGDKGPPDIDSNFISIQEISSSVAGVCGIPWVVLHLILYRHCNFFLSLQSTADVVSDNMGLVRNHSGAGKYPNMTMLYDNALSSVHMLCILTGAVPEYLMHILATLPGALPGTL